MEVGTRRNLFTFMDVPTSSWCSAKTSLSVSKLRAAVKLSTSCMSRARFLTPRFYHEFLRRSSYRREGYRHLEQGYDLADDLSRCQTLNQAERIPSLYFLRASKGVLQQGGFRDSPS
jgi:transposase-like protein